MILAPVTVRCPSNGRSASSTSGLLAPAAQSSAGRRMLLPPVAGCAAAEASPPPTIPTAGQALRRRQPHTAAEPVNPRTPLRAGFDCRVFPGSAPSPSFLGLVVVHHPGALGAAWSTWSRNDFHRKSTVRGEADSWVHGGRKEVPPYYAQNNYSST